MNSFYIGLEKNIEPPAGPHLYISKEVPDVKEWRRPKIFDPKKHSFNPIKNISKRQAREMAAALYAVYPQGENTLTVRNGRWALAPALHKADRLDKVKGSEEIDGLISDILYSPLLCKVLTGKENFTFSPNAVILARINPAEIGSFEAEVLTLLLMSFYKFQLVIPEFGRYGKDMHVDLVEEERLIAGCNFLGELTPKIRNSLLLVKDKHARGALFEDAVMLAKYEGLHPDPTREDNPYNRFIAAAIS